MPSCDKHSNIYTSKEKDESNEEIISLMHRIEDIVEIFDILALDT
jgi:hypothetical protein